MKKYPSLVQDLQTFQKLLIDNPFMGVELSGGFRKIRMSVKSKNKGKSGGARVITFNYMVNETCDKIVLVKIYDKSEENNVSDAQIKQIFETIR